MHAGCWGLLSQARKGQTVEIDRLSDASQDSKLLEVSSTVKEHCPVATSSPCTSTSIPSLDE